MVAQRSLGLWTVATAEGAQNTPQNVIPDIAAAAAPLFLHVVAAVVVAGGEECLHGKLETMMCLV